MDISSKLKKILSEEIEVSKTDIITSYYCGINTAYEFQFKINDCRNNIRFYTYKTENKYYIEYENKSEYNIDDSEIISKDLSITDNEYLAIFRVIAISKLNVIILK